MKIATLKLCIELISEKARNTDPYNSWCRPETEEGWTEAKLKHKILTDAISEINAAIDNTEVTLNAITKP
jgi:hypothetical protein